MVEEDKMTEEDCYLYVELRPISELEQVYGLFVYRKDLEGNPREKVLEMLAPKKNFEGWLTLLELLEMYGEYLINFYIIIRYIGVKGVI